MYARTYSPTLGRFLQPDPIAAEGNLYAYAGNSPITKADPSGRFWYRVRRGDSLEGLSRRFWGNPNHIRAIVAANVGRIAQRRSTIRPGQCINIPASLRRFEKWQDASCSRGSGRRSIDFGSGFLAGFKCAAAGYVVMQELSSVAIAGTASGAFVFGGELVPVGNGILLGVAAASGANAAYNFAFTGQAVRWCLGGASPTAPSTMFLPPNFPWRFVAP